jgi:hypothetical protein
MSKQQSASGKRFRDMSLDELRAATKEFDAEMIDPPGRALTPKERAAHRRLVAKRGRPIVGAGAERITTTIERSLLKAADEFAKRQGVSRAQLIADGLRLAMKAKGGRARRTA